VTIVRWRIAAVASLRRNLSSRVSSSFAWKLA